MAKYPGSIIINEIGTRADMAKAYGVSERTIYRWLNKAGNESGISPKTKVKRPRNSTLVNFKGTRKQLAKKYGVSERTAYRWLKQAKQSGSLIPSRQKQSKYPGTSAIMDIITNSALTNKQIAEQYGVSTRTVSRWIRRAKLERPQPAPDLRKTKQYKLRRKKTKNGNWYSWYEYIGDENAFIRQDEEAYNPENIIEDFTEAAETDYSYDPDYERLYHFDEWQWSNYSELDKAVLGNIDFGNPSGFRDMNVLTRLQCLRSYLIYQYSEDEHQFYDEESHQMMFDPDDDSIMSTSFIRYMDIWGDEFDDWLAWQDEFDEYLD